MRRFLAIHLIFLTSVFLFGCAHPINMNPNLTTVVAPAGTQVIDKQVGYFLSDALRAQEVITAGGGGDKVRYFPYRDIEPGFYKALSEVFRGVTKVQNPKDAAALKASGVSLLIAPEITTTSYSDSIVTWPPTQFTITLVCTATDVSGNPIQTVRVTGEGKASFDEFKSNFSLSAVRATNDVLTKLIKALSESGELRK